MNSTPTNEDQEPQPVVKAEEDATAYRLARMMQSFNVGSIIITRGDEPVGIVTDRDLALAVGSSAFTPDDLIAQDIMRSPITTVEAGTGLIEIIQTMRKNNVRRLPVVKDGSLVDIFTMDDVIRLVHETMEGLNEVIQAESPRKIHD